MTFQTADKPYYYYPALTLHPDELYTYSKIDTINEIKRKALTWKNNFKCNRISTEPSKKSKQKIERAIKYMLFYANEKKVYRTSKRSCFTFKVAFITLTLPSKQIHTDNEIKEQCLNQFLTELRTKWHVDNYIWKAEKQMNGNIHFHILVDKFVPYIELRNAWNRIVNKLGYVDRYRQIHHKLSPNSTDIHSLKKVKNVYAYISKYFKKQQKQNRSKVKASEINYTIKVRGKRKSVTNGAKMFLFRKSGRGRIYGCSYSLSNITGVRVEIDEDIQKEIDYIAAKKRTKKKEKDYVTCYFFYKDDINEIDTPILAKLLKDYIEKLFPPNQKNIDPPTGYYETI